MISETSLIPFSTIGFDLRPFLYPTDFKHQFAQIDALTSRVQARHAESKNAEKTKVDWAL
jgi:hypothetical protein